MIFEKINKNLTSSATDKLRNKLSAKLSNSIENLSSGLRINRSSDDAAGLRIATLLNSKIKGLTESFNQTQTTINYLNVADQGLSSINERLYRIRELTLQAGNDGIFADTDLKSIQSEIIQNIDEINRIANTTQFGKINLLNGSSSSNNTDAIISADNNADNNIEAVEPSYSSKEQINIQLEIEPNQGINIPFGDARSISLGIDQNNSLETIDITKKGGVDNALMILDAALEQINSIQSSVGALSGHLESSANSLSVASENLLASQSRLQNTDFAIQISEFIKDKLQNQAKISVQSQIQNLHKKNFINFLKQ